LWCGETSAALSNGSRLCFRIRSSRNENVADTLQDDFASLITQSDLVAHDASNRRHSRLVEDNSGDAGRQRGVIGVTDPDAGNLGEKIFSCVLQLASAARIMRARSDLR
jgi:hypothetical protein